MLARFGWSRLPLEQMRGSIENVAGKVASAVSAPELVALAPTDSPRTGLSGTLLQIPPDALTPWPAEGTAVPTPTETPVVTAGSTPAKPPEATGSGTPAATPAAPPAVPSTPTPAPTAAPTASPAPPATVQRSYTVAPGDTLQLIGEKTDVPWRTIAQLNGLSETAMLHPGQALNIPTEGAAPAQAAVPAATPAPARKYKVVSGDSLMVIGTKVGVAWQSIASANGIGSGTILSVGQELVIPAQ